MRRTVLSSVAGLVAGAVDGAFAAAIEARARRERRGDRPLADRLAELEAIAAAYGEPVVDGASFFGAPPALDLSSARLVHARTWELAWPSGFAAHLDAVAERYAAHVVNRTARARLYLAEAPDRASARPAVVAIHGYMGGHWLVEEAQWPIEWLLRRGLDVALPVLPMHAARAASHRGAPTFPSPDPRITIEGFRQAVHDVRALVAGLRARGAAHVGVLGVSLGGYVAALLATVAPEVDFVMPMIPLASLADFVREQGRLARGADGDVEHAAIDRVHRVVSPLARPPLLSPSRALVVGAERDRITPLTHAERLARHFGCELVTIEGGHVLQVGRGAAFRALGELLAREGIARAT